MKCPTRSTPTTLLTFFFLVVPVLWYATEYNSYNSHNSYNYIMVYLYRYGPRVTTYDLFSLGNDTVRAQGQNSQLSGESGGIKFTLYF